ncbi:recombinase family protein [Pseudoclavibacter sp. RFBB5]|uniref:recombinase family protein n=1 Tax=Pseudoclavibacter sp. RFBB5 TaxID=2080574 RepID=UPI000CE84FA4|nr:recombinase family protein [Pseudoclavibacter sp. RFBB5]PPG27211.1 resolvase [Pseudoclavibacter sp. RFBB5]
MPKLIGYARVSTRHQDTDRQEVDLRGGGVRTDDLYIDRGASGAHASRPALDKALRALEDGDTFVVTTLDRLGRSTGNMLTLAEELRAEGVALRVLNLGGGDVDTSTPMGSMVFTVMAALAQMELEIKRERVLDSVSKRRAAGANLGGRPRKITDSQLRNAAHLVAADVPVAEVARNLGISRATLYRRLQTAEPVEAELPPEVEQGTHPPALHGMTVPITRL